MDVEETRQRRFCETFDGNVGGSERKPPEHAMLDAHSEPNDQRPVSVKTGGKLRIEPRKIGFTSHWASVCTRGDRPIRKKIIGRSISVLRERFSSRSVVRRLLRTFPLLHQPARQHGRGILLDPKIQKRADFLAEIGGMTKTRKFITLQRVARSREKKFPRRLGFVVVHGASR